jgi:hypothetical protein
MNDDPLRRDREAELSRIRSRRAEREELRRRIRRRRAAVVAGLTVPVAVLVVASRWPGHHASPTPVPRVAHTATAPAPVPAHVSMPDVVRGVHVGMDAAHAPRTLDRIFAAARPNTGLNAVEVDVKDERGFVAFGAGMPALARHVGAVRGRYDPRAVARAAHRAGVYLIGRVVVFVDPILAAQRRIYSIRTSTGDVFRDANGRVWLNPFSSAVRQYALGTAKAAAEAGFDEVEFDFVRFPSPPLAGGTPDAVYSPGPRGELSSAMPQVVRNFLHRASLLLRPLGTDVSVSLLGLSATKDLDVGLSPTTVSALGDVVDVIAPTPYPTGFGFGQWGIRDPGAAPGDTVAAALNDWVRQLAGRNALLRPWLQAFSTPAHRYGSAEIRAEIRATQDLHTDGFMLWNPDSRYDLALLATR